MADFVPTRVSRLNQNAAKEFVSVDYKNPKKKRPKAIEDKESVKPRSALISDDGNEPEDVKTKQEREMKRVRYEVMKFGMSGFKGVEAEKAEVALAISLGAKPPKKKGVNYKQLKEERKSEKEARNSDAKLVSGLEKSLKKPKTKTKTKTYKTYTRKKGSDGLLGVYGKVSKKPQGKRK